MDNLTLVIVDDSKETRKNVRTLLSFEKRFEVIGEAKNGEEACSLVKELKPDIVLMDINMPGMDGIEATGIITVEVPDSVVIMMSAQGEREYFRKAMSAGAREFLTKPFTSEDLIETISRIFEKELKRRSASGELDSLKRLSKVITVFSTKGGVGKTTIATNIAAGIAKNTKHRVAILDLDLQFGDIAIMLNLSIKTSLSDLVKEISQVDRDTINEYMVTHYSGAKVLPAPLRPEYAEYITSSHIEKIVQLLKENYDYIIIDTSASFHETVLASLDASDIILLVSTLDLPTIKNIKGAFDVMDMLHYSKEKTRIVLNKASEHYGITYRDFEETVGRKIWAYIPEDSSTVVTASNKGIPFILKKSESKVIKSVLDIINRITEGERDETMKIDKAKTTKFLKFLSKA